MSIKRTSTASLQAFDDLLARIKKRLCEKGPATSDVLALELGAPKVNVTFALEVLSEGKERCVERLSGKEWSLTRAYMKHIFGE
jgi:hypothetical protein